MDQKSTKRLSNKKVYGPLCEKTLHSALKKELMTNFGFENMAVISDILIERFLNIIKEFTAEKERLQPYQTMVIGIDKHEKFGYGTSIADVKLKPAIITIMTPEEMMQLADGKPIRELRPMVVARILKESYSQGSVLSLSTMSVLLGVGHTTIGSAIKKYYKEHPGEVLPYAGTIFDMGRTLTHKDVALDCMYQGMLTQEIARRINHYPERVDKYLDDHKRIIEAYEAGYSVEKICFLTGLSTSLVKEHIKYYEKVKDELKLNLDFGTVSNYDPKLIS
jgi:hypothetical protein